MTHEPTVTIRRASEHPSKPWTTGGTEKSPNIVLLNWWEVTVDIPDIGRDKTWALGTEQDASEVAGGLAKEMQDSQRRLEASPYQTADRNHVGTAGMHLLRGTHQWDAVHSETNQDR